MKTYILKGKKGVADIEFSIADLVPVAQAKAYDFNQLAGFIDYRNYYAVEQFSKADFEALYQIPAHKNCDFFEIKDTGIILIPGNCLFPTALTEKQLINKS